jgi:hypothetical protein
MTFIMTRRHTPSQRARGTDRTVYVIGSLSDLFPRMLVSELMVFPYELWRNFLEQATASPF